MKVSYNTIKQYIPDVKSPEELAQDLIMHTAEVEEIIYEWEAFENIVYWKITSISDHEDADALKVCQVNVWEAEDIQIVCGWSNLKVEQAVAVADTVESFGEYFLDMDYEGQLRKRVPLYDYELRLTYDKNAIPLHWQDVGKRFEFRLHN